MAIREVLQLGDPALRVPAQPVADPGAPEIAVLLTDLADTLAHWRATTSYGRGIAAPQIGAAHRVIFLNLDGASPWPLLNPTITARSDDMMTVWDACLSFLCIFGQVTRHRAITVRYQDTGGAWHTLDAEGDLAELLQHELDHLDGVLAVDRLTDPRSLCVRDEFERRYRAHSPYAV